MLCLLEMLGFHQCIQKSNSDKRKKAKLGRNITKPTVTEDRN